MRGKNVARNQMSQAVYVSRGLMNTGSGIALIAAAVLVGCNGWPQTVPYEQAEHRAEKYPTYAASPASAVEMFYAGNHRFMVMPGEAQLRTARTVSVPANAPVSVFALEGDAAPYSVLFARTADGRTHAVAAID